MKKNTADGLGFSANAVACSTQGKEEGVGIRGDIKVTLYEEDGTVAQVQERRNLVLDTGLTIWPQILNGTKTPTTASVEVGSATTAPAVSQTGVITLLATDAAPIKEVNGASITYHALFSTVTGTINEVALKINAVGVARQLVSPGLVMSGLRRCTVEWTFTFGRTA